MAYLIMLMHMPGDCGSVNSEAEVDCVKGCVLSEHSLRQPTNLRFHFTFLATSDIQIRRCSGIFYLILVQKNVCASPPPKTPSKQSTSVKKAFL